MAFNVNAALAEGYTPSEIAEHLAKQRKFDLAGARSEGYTDDEIVAHLANVPKSGILRRAGDIGLSAIQGAIGIPEAAVGLADIPTGGRVGKALEGVGFRPQEAKQILQEYKSPEQQAAERSVQEAEGFIPTIKTAVQNPSAIASTIAQSVPSMVGGAGIARGVLSAAPKLGALAAGAIGEGAVGAGLSAEDIRQQSESGLLTDKQAGLSALSGIFTGVLGGFGGKVAQKYLKVGDIDTILAGGASPAEKSGLLTSMFKAGLSEAVLEELPQSGQEQVMRNLALDKPWDEGVAESMAMGVLAALPMGAGGGYSSYRAGAQKTAAEEAERQATLSRINAERAQQDAGIAEARQATEQAQYAGEERAADIAGKAGIDEQFAVKPDLQPNQQAELDLYPETTVEEIAARRASESAQGDLFTPPAKPAEPKLDEPTITSFGFKKNSLAYKALEKLNDPQITPEEQASRFDEIIENNQAKIKTTEQGNAVNKFKTLLNQRIPTTPVAEETVNEPAIITEQRGQPDALRGTPDQTGVDKTQLERVDQRDVVPSETGAPAPTETQAAVTRPLGDAGRTIGRPEVRAETSQEVQPAALVRQKLSALVKQKAMEPEEYRGYLSMLTESGPEYTKAILDDVFGDITTTQVPTAGVSPEVQQSFDEAKAMEAETDFSDIPTETAVPEDQYFESRKAKAKKDAKPKQAETKLRAPTTEPTTPEVFAEKVSQWFNPVWYKQATKNGMVNVVKGDINDSDLSDAVKEKYANAKALFTPDGKAYFFTKNITRGNELGVFLHEIGEHKGLDNLIGKDRVKQLANRVRQMAEGKGSAKEIAMAKQAVEMAEGQNDKEIIAYFGEIAVFNGIRPGIKAKPEFGKALGWITELWSAIKNAVQKMHINPEKITDKDIVDMLYGAARLELGAAQTFEEQVGDLVPDEPEILASVARNPALELSPEEVADRKARGLTVRPPPQRQTMKEKMQDTMGMSKGRDEFFNRMGNAIVGPLFTIHRKATEYYGPEGMYTKSTGKLLGSLMGQHSLNSNNFAFEGIKRGGLKTDEKGFVSSFDSDDNIVNLNKDYDALMNALQADGVSKATAYQQIANMILADRYKSLKMIGAKSTDEFTQEDAAEGYALREKHQALYDQWRNRYNAMRKNKIDFLVQSGAYTRKEAEKLMNRLEYVPLYRIKDSEGADGIFMQGLLSSKQQQKLQFDTKNYDVADIMTNIALNEMWLYKKAIFNHTTNLLIDQVEEMGGGKHVKVKNPNDEQTIAYLRDGELKFFKFDDPNDMAMLRAVPVINNWAVNQMRFLGGILRKGITLTPSFIYRQVWQDVERGWMQSGTNQPFHKMLGQSIREQAKNAKRDSETRLARELRSRGVIGAVEYQDSFENAIDELFGRDKADKTLFEKAYKKLEYMEKLAQNSDMAARAIVYENALAEGANEGEAALRAQMMLNYQHRGTSPAIRALLSTIPFINTKLQSEWRLVEAIQGKIPGLPKEKARKLLFAKVLKMALLSAAYAMTRSGDDDYEEASDEQRNRNFLINVGGIPLRIPVAPEYMLIKAGMEQATRLTMDAEFASDRKLGHAVLSSIGGLLLGVDDVTPAILRPLLENMTNYSFFNDRALVGQGLQQRDVNLQYVEGQTSELAKFISNSLQAVGGNVVNVSPIKIDNFINGVFGTMGRDVLFTTNLIAEGISGNERPELKLSQLPEVGTAFYNPEGSQRVADYYQVRDKVMSAYNSYRSLVKTDPQAAREYLAENRKLIALRGPVDAIGNRLEQLRAKQNKILADDSLSEEQKREAVDKITQQKNQVVTGPTKMLRKRMEE